LQQLYPLYFFHILSYNISLPWLETLRPIVYEYTHISILCLCSVRLNFYIPNHLLSWQLNYNL
jgi:hypothetical protein